MKIKGLNSTDLDFFINRINQNLDPIVEDIARINRVDIYSATFNHVYNRMFLFTAFLIVHHPKIIDAIEKIRRRINLNKLLRYKKEITEEGEYFNTTFANLDKNFKKVLRQELDRFFSEFGKKLPRRDWNQSIATFTLTGTIPVPFNQDSLFEIHKNITEDSYRKINQYPVIVIKKRIKKRELNPLIQYMRDHEKELVSVTRNLPKQMIKRFDIDLTELAIGLWLYKNRHKSNDELEEWMMQRYHGNEGYFGKYSPLGKDEFPNFKAKAIFYLNKLFPL